MILRLGLYKDNELSAVLLSASLINVVGNQKLLKGLFKSTVTHLLSL